MKTGPVVSPVHRSRVGFTLIELLVVIAIISILMGLILAALNNDSAKVAEVTTDMSQMAIAIGQFEVKYKMDYLPSKVSLYSTAAGWNGDVRSRSIIKKIWPRFNFASPPTLPGGQTAVTLTGDECLVFFLAGFPRTGPHTGFSSNPTNPFKAGGSRIGPFYEFKGGFDGTVWNGRLVDPDGDGFPSYTDPMTQEVPYLYLSSYGGKGYRVAEQTEFGFIAYRRDKAGKTPYNPQKYQIIASGGDNKLGVGGYYNSDNEEVGRVDANGVVTQSEADRDNITNFQGGKLIP